MRQPGPRRRPLPSESPFDLVAAVQDGLYERQLAWRNELLRDHPDWTTLFGLHLQMAELEAFLASASEAV